GGGLVLAGAGGPGAARRGPGNRDGGPVARLCARGGAGPCGDPRGGGQAAGRTGAPCGGPDRMVQKMVKEGISMLEQLREWLEGWPGWDSTPAIAIDGLDLAGGAVSLRPGGAS